MQLIDFMKNLFSDKRLRIVLTSIDELFEETILVKLTEEIARQFAILKREYMSVKFSELLDSQAKSASAVIKLLQTVSTENAEIKALLIKISEGTKVSDEELNAAIAANEKLTADVLTASDSIAAFVPSIETPKEPSLPTTPESSTDPISSSPIESPEEVLEMELPLTIETTPVGLPVVDSVEFE